jgi:AraC family transcriptional regulator
VASGAPGFFEKPAGEVSPRIRRLSMDLAAMMLADPGAGPKQEQVLSDLMISVIERFTPWRTLRAACRTSIAIATDWRIRRAVDLIRLEPQAARDVDSLAKEAGLSWAHFYRLFERSTRMTPHVYLNLLRMELALKSVVHTDQRCPSSATISAQRAESFHSLLPRPRRG